MDKTSNYGGEKFCVVDSYSFKKTKAENIRIMLSVYFNVT